MKKKVSELDFENAYLSLPNECFSKHDIAPLNKSHIISANKTVFDLLEMDFDEIENPDFIDWITAQKKTAQTQPFAMCYAGHQFGHLVPRLGDGRALMVGQIKTSNDERWDIQIKGGGPTLYSRGSDGRAVLRSTIREYLCSEAMFNLGIASTRSLCMIGSEEEVYRESIEKGAMLLRVAPSHIRFGSFEYFYYKGQLDDLKTLADFTLEHYFADLLNEDEPYLALLNNAIDSTAKMIAKWQAVGFSHGVMNTDNMSIHGLTIDYGPFGFLDNYEPGFICNHSDHQGRYAFDKQPSVGHFNLSCLAQALLPLLDKQPDEGAKKAIKALESYPDLYAKYYAKEMRAKLGLKKEEKEDKQLVKELLSLLAVDKVDYTLFFRLFSKTDQKASRDMFINRTGDDNSQGFDGWMQKYEARLTIETLDSQARSQLMLSKNPKYILRNYIAQNVIEKAEAGDYSELEKVFKLLQNPFDEQPEFEHYAGFPPDWASKISVSCSS